tara:strand:- start:2102 stop:2398 length:297 start_codon:yes stop_codon:yes gene_type:complete
MGDIIMIILLCFILILLLRDTFKDYIKERRIEEIPWYEKYNSSYMLTQKDKALLSQYTEDQWCDMIPYEFKVNIPKYTIVESVRHYKKYLKHWSEKDE